MPNWYTHRDLLKASIGLEGSATGAHTQLDAVLEGVAREIDRFVGFHFYSASGIRYYTPKNSTCLDLGYPLTALDAVALDTDGNASYNSTLTTTDYYLIPYNATEESPKRPFWAIELAVNSTAAFPRATQRGARITGTWGYYNQTTSVNVALTTTLAATATQAEVTNSSLLHPGQTVLIDSEQVFVVRNGKSGSDTATSSGIVGIERAKNGTTAAAHATTGVALSVYEYPVVDKASLYQSEMDYRANAAPLGFTGGLDGGGQTLSPGAGGLHPFTRRTLEQFRVAVAR